MSTIITCFRSVPPTADSLTVGGVCWASAQLQDPRLVAAYPGNKWAEIEVAMVRTGPYVTSEDMETLTFGEEDGWYSFPVSFIIRWRWVGEKKWHQGAAYRRYAAAALAAEKRRKAEKELHRRRMTVDGTDWEAILASQGLGLIE